MGRVSALLFVLLTASLGAFELTLAPDSLAEAISIGRTGIESQRTEFQRPYRLVVARPPLDYVEVITPFRRVVLAAESRLLRGERLFGQQEALAVLGDTPDRVELRLEMTFNPLNTFVGVPGYGVALVAAKTQTPIQPTTLERVPRFGPRVEGQRLDSGTQVRGVLRGQSQPLAGGTVVAVFAGNRLERDSIYDVLVTDGDKTVAVVGLDFSKLR